MKKIPLVDVTALSQRQVIPLTRNDVDHEFMTRYISHGMNFNKDLALKGTYCFHPFNTVTIDHKGRCFVCICQAWLPISVGNILDFNSLEEIVQSPKAREIQRSIIDGSFRYCDNTTCNLIISEQLEPRINHKPDTVNWINFAIDDSCNLQCPSCRTDLRFVKQGPEFELRMQIADHVAKMISNHNHFLRFTLSADGDPFASHVYRNLMQGIHGQPREQLEIEIVTNGIMLGAHWNDLTNIHHNIVRVKVSFDAANELTYNQVRRGGDWQKLLANSKFLNSWLADRKAQRQNIGTTTESNFVVQTANYKQMKDFVLLSRELGFDKIVFQKVTNWNTWIDSNGVDQYNQQAVWQPHHPEYAELKTLLKDSIFDSPDIKLGNLEELR